ncbi:MAG: hypothetical protein ACHQ49_05975 [Elusimicrobiota bacterium]
MEPFLQELMRTIERDITDAVFLFVEHDKRLMEQYQRLVNEGLLHELNKAIGERVKAHFHLINEANAEGVNERNEAPRSKLIITSHQRYQPWRSPGRE